MRHVANYIRFLVGFYNFRNHYITTHIHTRKKEKDENEEGKGRETERTTTTGVVHRRFVIEEIHVGEENDDVDENDDM